MSLIERARFAKDIALLRLRSALGKHPGFVIFAEHHISPQNTAARDNVWRAVRFKAVGLEGLEEGRTIRGHKDLADIILSPPVGPGKPAYLWTSEDVHRHILRFKPSNCLERVFANILLDIPRTGGAARGELWVLARAHEVPVLGIDLKGATEKFKALHEEWEETRKQIVRTLLNVLRDEGLHGEHVGTLATLLLPSSPPAGSRADPVKARLLAADLLNGLRKMAGVKNRATHTRDKAVDELARLLVDYWEKGEQINRLILDERNKAFVRAAERILNEHGRPVLLIMGRAHAPEVAKALRGKGYSVSTVTHPVGKVHIVEKMMFYDALTKG